MAGVSNADRAAEQIDTASQARAVANTPRPASGDRAGAVADIGAARELLGESLPAGDWNALTSAFNKLDDEQRAAVFAALPADTRKFLSGMVDPSQPTPAFLPNLVAERTRRFDVSGLPDPLAARQAAPQGNTDTAAMLIELTASRVAAQRQVALLEIGDEIDAARGNDEAMAPLVARREEIKSKFGAILSSRERLAAIAAKQADDESMAAMESLDAAARKADSEGDAARAAELRRKIGLVERQVAERAQSFEAALSPAPPTAATGLDESVDAARFDNENLQAATALRNAIIGTDPMYRAEQRRLLDASRPQPQPAAITPGARTPVFAAEDVPAAEMPTAFDTAQAAAREAEELRQRRAPGGGSLQDDRVEAVKDYLRKKLPNNATDAQRARIESIGLDDLPLFLKGRDRSIPLDYRAQGSRADYVSPGGQRILEKGSAAEDAIAAAYAELDAVEGVGEWRAAVKQASDALLKAERSASRATGLSQLARANQKLTAARDAYTAAVQSNPAAFEKMRQIDSAHAALDGLVPGMRYAVSISDRKLNKAGPAQTYSDMVSGVTGFKRPDDRVMDRASAGLDPADARALGSEASQAYGNDASELLQGAETADEKFSVSPNRRALSESAISIEDNGQRKPSRLGSSRSENRSASSLDRGLVMTLPGTKDQIVINPLELSVGGNVLYKDADAFAADVLSRDAQYPADSQAALLAREDFARQTRKRFGDDGTILLGDNPNLDASATVILDTESEVAPVAAAATETKKGGKRSSGRKKAEAETAAPATDAASEVAPITGRTKTVKEIQDEANEIEREARKAAIDEGMDVDDADAVARKARKDHVDREMEAQKEIAAKTGSGKPVTDPAPAAATTKADAGDSEVKPTQGATVTDEASNVTDNLDASATEIDGTIQPNTTRTKTYDTGTPPADEAPGSTVRTKQYDVGDQAQPPKTNTDSGTQQAAPPATKPSWKKRILVGSAIAGGIAALNNMTRPSGPFQLPPGVGPAGGAGPQDVPVSFPPGAAGMGEDSMDDTAAAAEVERLTRALNRVRGQRAMNPSETSQTLLNYNAGYR
jgi:hypothetical protein